jgi:hypothetical protein
MLTATISLNSVNHLIFVMVKCGAFFAVRTEFLNIIYLSFRFNGLGVLIQIRNSRSSNSYPALLTTSGVY